jgi:hypothetical protein
VFLVFRDIEHAVLAAGILAPKKLRESCGQFGLKMAFLRVIGATDFPRPGIPKWVKK